MKKICYIIFALGIVIFSSCRTNECICPDFYSPVCGDNGKTYPNPCEAECHEVSYYEGQCPVYGIGKIIFAGDTATNGCGFLIEILTQKYKPVNLEGEFKEADLWVSLKYRILNQQFNCNSPIEQYFEIEIIEIDKL